MIVACVYCREEVGQREASQCECGAYTCGECNSGAIYRDPWRCCDARMNDAIDACLELLEEMSRDGQ